MALPLIDVAFGVRDHTHKAMKRLAKNRGITLSQLGRDIIEKHISKEIHDAKIILGMDDDNGDQAELDLDEGESHRIAPRGRR